VLLPEPFQFFVYFFRGALETGEGNKISPHKTSRPTLFKEITWCVLKQRDNVVFMQTSSSKAAVYAVVSILHVIMTLSLVCVRACVCVCVRNAMPFSLLNFCAKQNKTYPLSVRSYERSDSQRRRFHEISIFTKIYGTFRFWLKPHKNDIHITWQNTRV
jgi:hypothetical protein